MSISLFLISLELVMMVVILLLVPRDIVGYCFLGFAIGESLGAWTYRRNQQRPQWHADL
jgi:K(+)-stimulated pyrophosphate-energized sodium pump